MKISSISAIYASLSLPRSGKQLICYPSLARVSSLSDEAVGGLIAQYGAGNRAPSILRQLTTERHCADYVRVLRASVIYDVAEMFPIFRNGNYTGVVTVWGFYRLVWDSVVGEFVLINMVFGSGNKFRIRRFVVLLIFACFNLLLIDFIDPLRRRPRLSYCLIHSYF